MNRSRIEWCDHTWNPITGCLHACQYCYARKMTARFSGDVRLNKMAVDDYQVQKTADGKNDLYILEKPMLNETGKSLVYPFGFEPTFHKYRLNVPDKLKNGQNIFVGAMADIFGEWVPREWIDEVMSACVANSIHNYLFLTKNPERYTEYGVPAGFENLWYGTSITRESEMSKFNYLSEYCKTFVSLEPILEDLQPEHNNILFQQVDWIIIGAETGNRKGKTAPKWDWIKRIVLQADSYGVPVFMKESLIEIVGEKNMRREYPVRLRKKEISAKLKAKLESKCCKCGTHMRKNLMISLSARSKRGEMARQLCYMCHSCFKDFCNELNISIPDLINLTNEEGQHNEEKKLPDERL